MVATRSARFSRCVLRCQGSRSPSTALMLRAACSIPPIQTPNPSKNGPSSSKYPTVNHFRPKPIGGEGFTVFVVSWKNPDASMDDIDIEDYMDLGPLAASDVAREITGSPTVNAMGYCIGGTLLTLTLATLAGKGDNRFNSASFMVSMQDFSRVGDTAVFMDEPAIDLIEQQMMERGYL